MQKSLILRRVRVAVLAALFAVAGVIVAPATPAQASAQGCSIWSTVQTPIPFPAGSMCIEVYGSGTTWSQSHMNWWALNMCNYRIDWVIIYGGKTTWRQKGANHNHCDYVSGVLDRGKGSAPNGALFCAQIWQLATNKMIDGACVHINK